MNIVAKIMCIVTISAFCAAGFFATPDEIVNKNKARQVSESQQLAFCVPQPADVSSTLHLARTFAHST